MPVETPPPQALPESGTAQRHGAPTSEWVKRPPRVHLPVLVSFAASSYAVRDYVLNLSEGGIFLQTDETCPVGSRGKLKFRFSGFDDPFELEGEVVRVVSSTQVAEGRAYGMGLRFIDLDDRDRLRLRKLVDGVRSGSVVNSIRLSLRDNEHGVEAALRNKPTDQKMILAQRAQGQEIDLLIRDRNPSVLLRLLECPRLQMHHVQMMLRDCTIPTRLLSGIRKSSKWMNNEECRWLFCIHPGGVLTEVVAELARLPVARLTQLQRNTTVRPQIRMKAQEMLRRKKRAGASF